MIRGIKRKFDELQPSDEKQLSLNTLDSGCMSVLQYLSYRERGIYPSAIRRQTRETPELLLTVVQGNEEEAKRLLEINPGLLCSKLGEAIDYSGRCIEGLTPFQAALCAGDVEMCEMMKALVGEEGQAELEKQFNAVFPDGLEAHQQTQESNVFDFNEILQAIIDAPAVDVTAALNKEFNNDLPLHKALDKFREEFKNKSLSEIVFNPHHLLKAFQTYDAKFDDLGDWNKRDLFWRQVIGFAQRYLPACYLQAFAQGICYIIDDKKQLHRSFQFRQDPSTTCLPDPALAGLGYDFAASVCCRVPVRGSTAGLKEARILSKLCRAKTSILEKLRSLLQRPGVGHGV